MLPPEPEQLAAAKPAGRCCEHERPVPRLDAIGELVDLAERGQLPLGGVLGAGTTDRAGIGGQRTVIDCGVDDGVQQPVAVRHGARPRTALDHRGVPRPDRRRPELAERDMAQQREDVEPEQALLQLHARP